jgi:hypothetical protein
MTGRVALVVPAKKKSGFEGDAARNRTGVTEAVL